MVRACRLDHQSVCLSVCLSVRKVYCVKTADWIRMSFAVVSGVGLGMGVLDFAIILVLIVEGEGAVFEVNLGRPVVTSGAFATRSSQITLRTCCC